MIKNDFIVIFLKIAKHEGGSVSHKPNVKVREHSGQVYQMNSSHRPPNSYTNLSDGHFRLYLLQSVPLQERSYSKSTQAHWNWTTDEVTLFQSSTVPFWWTCVHWGFSSLCVAHRHETFCWWTPSASVFGALFILRRLFSLIANEKPLVSLPSLPWPRSRFSLHVLHTILSKNTTGCYEGKSLQISSIWNTQTSPPSTNNHTMDKNE